MRSTAASLTRGLLGHPVDKNEVVALRTQKLRSHTSASSERPSDEPSVRERLPIPLRFTARDIEARGPCDSRVCNVSTPARLPTDAHLSFHKTNAGRR
jgi:hypothetical protein